MPINKRRSRYSAIVVLLAVGLFVFFQSQFITKCVFPGNNVGEQTVLQVNNSTMSAREFAAQFGQKLKIHDALSVKNPAVVNNTKEEVIREFITQVITQDWARENNIFVRAENLEAEINGIRSYYPDDLAFRRALSLEGLSYNEWKERMKFSRLQKLVLAHLSSLASEPSLEEIKSYYDNNKEQFKQLEAAHLRQVVLDSENNARRIVEALKEGKKFENLARQFSIAPEGQNGGDLGWIEKGTLDIFDNAFKMSRGQTSQVLKSPYGFHIIRVIDKRRERFIPFEQAKVQILRSLVERREQGVYASWLENQIRKAKVFKNTQLIDSIEVETRGDEE